MTHIHTLCGQNSTVLLDVECGTYGYQSRPVGASAATTGDCGILTAIVLPCRKPKGAVFLADMNCVPAT
jgi:hypothetical protein